MLKFKFHEVIITIKDTVQKLINSLFINQIKN